MSSLDEPHEIQWEIITICLFEKVIIIAGFFFSLFPNNPIDRFRSSLVVYSKTWGDSAEVLSLSQFRMGFSDAWMLGLYIFGDSKFCIFTKRLKKGCILLRVFQNCEWPCLLSGEFKNSAEVKKPVNLFWTLIRNKGNT